MVAILKTYNWIMQRVVIYPKDVQRITGKSEKYSRRLIKKLKETNGKAQHQFISIEEFANYSGLPVELIKEHIVD
jgi:hypothetical protein